MGSQFAVGGNGSGFSGLGFGLFRRRTDENPSCIEVARATAGKCLAFQNGSLAAATLRMVDARNAFGLAGNQKKPEKRTEFIRRTIIAKNSIRIRRGRQR